MNRVRSKSAHDLLNTYARLVLLSTRSTRTNLKECSLYMYRAPSKSAHDLLNAYARLSAAEQRVSQRERGARDVQQQAGAHRQRQRARAHQVQPVHEHAAVLP
ncbi:unnamed protein product, partial [Brenthis ino]